jgi:exosortase/archaeosortase family protein
MKRKTKKKLLEVIWFLIKFNLLAIPLYILIFLNFSFQPLQNLVALLSYKALSVIGIQVSLNQSSLTVIKEYKINVIEISMDCTGWKSVYALFALTISTPAIEIGKKLRFLSISIPALLLFNILRIVTTIYLSLNLSPGYFGLIHDIFWQWGLIVAILIIWVSWLKLEKRI